MGKPIVGNWIAVNPTIQPGGSPQIRVAFTPAADNKNLWFRFDLRQNPGSWIEGTWVQVNKTAGTVTLTYTRGGVPGIPSDWGGNKQVSLDAQLVWGEGGRGSGALIGRKLSLFSIASTTPAGTKPNIISATPVNGSIPIGGPAQLKVTYNSDVDGYLRLDLKKQAAILSAEGSPIIGWNEGTWEHITAGQNKEVTLTFTNVPTNWRPDRGVRACAAQVVWSSSGSGRGGYVIGQEKVFNILAAGQGTVDTPAVFTTTPTPTTTSTPTPTPITTTTPTDTTPTDTTTAIGGLTKWLKDNWVIVALISAVVLLVVPGRSSKNN